MKTSNRTRIVLTLCTALMAFQTVVMAATKPADLQRGKDCIDVPAIGEGLCLHNLFQSNMIIQRDKPIRIWGRAAPDEKVSVSFAGKKQTAIAGADRAWEVTFAPMSANSEQQTMTVKGAEKTLTLDNILLGDIWVMGGQSNMQFPLSNAEDGKLEIASANFPLIRVLTVPALIDNERKQGFPRIHRWEGSRHEREGNWDVCSPATAGGFPAIGYIFARRVQMASQIPIGIIDASRWGTTVETWIPLSILEQSKSECVRELFTDWNKKVADFAPHKDLENRVAQFNKRAEDMKKRGQKNPPNKKVPTDLRPSPAINQNYPGNCYASMIEPIAGFAVKGALFHQGFNNSRADAAALYYELFPKMISAWRTALCDSDLPFGIISLCTDSAPQTPDNYLECMANFGIYVREAQYKTFLDLYSAGDKNIGFASSYDMRRSWYHPQLKVPVGERISRWALATQYGKNIAWKPPMITDMKTEGGKIVLSFDMPVDAGHDNPIEGFAIAAKDRRFQPAVAQHVVTGKDSRNRPTYDYNRIVLSSPYVADPIHYRYAWGRNPMGNLKPRYKFDSAILATQRSDDWKICEVPIKFGEKADRNTANLVREANRILDMDRRLKDAQRLLDEHKQKNAAELKKLKDR